MFGLNGGEWFIVVFVTVMVVSARYWPALAMRVAVRLGGGGSNAPNAPHAPNTNDAPRE